MRGKRPPHNPQKQKNIKKQRTTEEENVSLSGAVPLYNPPKNIKPNKQEQLRKGKSLPQGEKDPLITPKKD